MPATFRSLKGILILGGALLFVRHHVSGNEEAAAEAWSLENPSSNNPTMKESIQKLLEKYENALNGGDIATIMSLYSKAPVFMPQHAGALVGSDAVRAGYEFVFNTIRLNVTFTVHEVVESAGFAYARTSSAGTTDILATNQTVSEGNNEIFILIEEGCEWKIHRYIFSTTNPPKA